MNEKERIMELVRQNVITLEEALTLLEAVGNSDAQNPSLKEDPLHKPLNKHSRNDQIDKFVDNVLETGSQVGHKVADYLKKSLTEDQAKDTDQPNYYAEEFKEDQAAEEARWRQAEPTMKEADHQALDQEIAELLAQVDAKKEKQLINQQRLRELEIFEELDDLTEEMQVQKSDLLSEKEALEEDIKNLSDSLGQLYAQKAQTMNESSQPFSEQNREYLKAKADDFSRFTARLADDAIRSGKQVSQGLGQQFKEIFKNFDRKDINLSFEVPWIKSQTLQHRFEFAGEDLKNIQFKLNNGSLKVEKAPSDKVIVAGELRFHGNFEKYDAEEFANHSTIDAHEDCLIFQVNSPRLSADLTLSLPEKDYNQVQISLFNGDGQIEDIQAKEIDIQNKNGDLDLARLTASLVNVMNLNGDIKLTDMDSQDIVAKTLSGDIRLTGNAENLNFSTSAGSIFISKKDATTSQIQAQTTSGDIKISQPAQVNLQVIAASTTGAVHQRLTSVDTVQSTGSHTRQEIQRQLDSQDQLVTIDAKVISGDIYLKDAEV
ncbi:DUF4097 family beta strand repeat-containing protein [Ignavigranum ruoffiae]|uniref:DUF4097 family beta strand repeat-containing protein n=1 Tax=Ignavigranum ruoffiae TaxID=89093 RepID=UPI00205E2FC1|nr:DUF4097 family beta strand repeat-containing protein [Ignavigranum ruoffiae]UPQ86269.1 DUF4097 family beta strand repeat-containing protein [Ignavigranum ruoffiae]